MVSTEVATLVLGDGLGKETVNSNWLIKDK